MPFSTDTRTLQPGDTYVAVRGETHDGHTFVSRAVEKGASAVVVEEPVDVPGRVEVTEVESSVGHLVELASARVRELGCPVVAITGSVGKTTARTAVVSVLEQGLTVKGSEGNKNTPLGLSLALLNADLTPETVLVLEMGARLEGDIRELCAAFPPTVGVVTNVRPVHVETLGSVDGVEREKSEIVRALDAEGTAVLNGDDPRARRMSEVTAGRVVLYGTGADCDVRPEHVTATLPILGDHAIYTALAATAVGRVFDLDDAAITRGLEAMTPEAGRLRRLDGVGGSTLVDDTYNASPDATVAALDVLAGLGERRTAFLGDMLELGADEVAEHVRVLRAALDRADRVVAVGEIMGRAVQEMTPEERGRIETAVSSRAAAGALRAGGPFELGPRDAVLVKGSQGARMERVSEALLHPALDPADVLPRQSEQWKAIQ
ncbi:UDP-N-acetylmuramoyl-tripeptide--D-alanyl-D-alanine ligase [Rubrivirga sp.]|uniref:UDP-N-acetylmuramoyl-tripeptide--D-alanyl-D- alanine ligase n=1 Tax=Rubrivirga sp. TaxID=1885344 RepID=UPI003B51A8AE